MAGNVLVICMLSVSGLGAYVAFRKPEAPNVLGGILTFYLVATAWATATRGEAESWKLEWITPQLHWRWEQSGFSGESRQRAAE